MFKHENISIHKVEEEDLSFLAELHNDPSVWTNLTDISMVTQDSQLKWLKHINSSKSTEYFVITDNLNNRIGLVRFTNIDLVNRSICVGADLHTSVRGKGFGTQTYKLILDYCFNYYNMNRVWLLVADYNTVAINLYKKMGFKIEGVQEEALYRFGKYHNYIMMSILKREFYE